MTALDPRGPRVRPQLLAAFAIVAVFGVAIGLAVQEWGGRGFTASAPAQLERAKEAIQDDNQFAIRVFSKLADRKNPDAQYWLGYMTELGLGIPRDPETAIELYKRAAAQNVVAAELRLGELYLHGNLVPPDFLQAKVYLKEAAYRGDPRAAMLLGRMYRLGLGVIADPTAAYAWLEVAVLEGSTFAKRERDASLQDLSVKDQKVAIARAKEILAEIEHETTVRAPPSQVSSSQVS
jgi:TPR repeat protein